MENQINSTIKKLAARMHKREDAVWNLYLDSGLDYLDALGTGITHYRVLNSQFGGLLKSGLLQYTPDQTFKIIAKSPIFWNWWAGELWSVAIGNYQFGLIPENILTKIFTKNERRKNTKQRKRAEVYASAEA